MSDAAATYDIGINLKKVGDGWDDLSAGVGSFTSLIDRAAGKLASLGSYAALGAVTAGIAGLTYGITGLNAQAEGAAISLGTIFSVNGLSSDVPAGIKMAGDTIAKMRVDAQKLPGEFEDLQTIFTMGATSAFRSGASIDKWRTMSANAMAAGATLMMPMDQVAREMTQLLEGHAGGHNVFGSKMGFTGDEARKLNAMSTGDRFTAISKELTKFSGSLDIFADSWGGLSSTFVDNVKNFGRAATEPLFESLKGTLKETNDWFDRNQKEIGRFAKRLGDGLEDAFELGERKIKQWYPEVENFVEVAYQRMVNFWADVQPYVSSFASMMHEALSDPNGTINKLTDLLQLYATYKVGSLALGLAGAGSQAMKGAGSAAMALGGAQVAAGAAAAAPSAAGSVLFFDTLGTAGLSLGPFATSVVAATAPLAAFASVAFAAYEAWGLYQEVGTDDRLNAEARARAHADEITSMIAAGAAQDEITARAAAMHDGYAASLSHSQAQFDAMGNYLGEFEDHIVDASVQSAQKLSDVAVAAAMASNSLAMMNAYFSAENRSRYSRPGGPQREMPTMKGGHGGTSIQKVEIVVTSNQNPSRIALAIHSKLAGLSTNKRYSPDVPNYSAPDEGG